MITITHNRAEGTLVQGTARGDGSNAPLKAAGFRWSRQLSCWYLPHSRDNLSKSWAIRRAVDALKAAGFEVTTEIDDSAPGRDMAEIESERADRAEARAERFSEYAGNASERAASTYAQARQMSEAIPFGQPMMPDHYSYNRDRNYRNRMQRTYERSFAEMGKAEHWADRSQAAEANQRHRESVPVTLRRIEKLEADARRLQRGIDGRMDYVQQDDGEYKLQLVKPQGRYLERLTSQLAGVQAQITYWRKHVEESGAKVWGPADFTAGDFVHGRWGWAEVLRVNPKSLTIPWGSNAVHLPVVTRDNVKDAMGGNGWRDKVTYDDVRGRRSAAEMAAALAAAEAQQTSA
jgi:hypothetical protein